jgi:hypothetical protein
MELLKLKCSCGALATWLYTPSYDKPRGVCDEHMRWGCSCVWDLKPGVEVLLNDFGEVINPPADYDYLRDKNGRPKPCVEYDHISNEVAFALLNNTLETMDLLHEQDRLHLVEEAVEYGRTNLNEETQEKLAMVLGRTSL